MMLSKVSSQHRLFYLIFFCFLLVIPLNYDRLVFNIYEKHSNSLCFKWQSNNYYLFIRHSCLKYAQISSLIWTHEGTGIMKYIQWIVTRNLANIRLIRLNHVCDIIQEKEFISNPTIGMFIQVYFLPFTVNLTNKSRCSMRIFQTATIDLKPINQIYFQRKSIKATVMFQHLDFMKEKFDLTREFNISYHKILENALHFTKYFANYYMMISNIELITIHSEDLIHTNLIDCERTLTEFLLLLGLNTSAMILKNIVQYDSHQFLRESIWWDESEVAERILTLSFPSRPATLTYSNDFYYLHGDRSFIQYLFNNRQCYNQGIFAQIQTETVIKKSERCSVKPFDCSFSDLYSFNDREEIYQQYNIKNYFNSKSLKCGFAIPSIFDKVRNLYGRNHTCETIIFTAVTNCYDPLPVITGKVLPSFCFIALLDTKTIDAYKRLNIAQGRLANSRIKWDLIDLGFDATPFRVAAKTAETLKIVGQRMFPMAKWIIWLDGKAHIDSIDKILTQAHAPVIGAHHPDVLRTSESEVYPTIGRLQSNTDPLSIELNNSIQEIGLQRQNYKYDGFYSRSDALGLTMFDIAIFMYRNNHPCIFRYLCGWHNEVNYFSHRGQLSVYYSAVRLNLTDYLHFLPKIFYATYAHLSVC